MDKEGRKRKSRNLGMIFQSAHGPVHAYNTISLLCLDQTTTNLIKKRITRPDPPSPRLHRPHAQHPILPHVQTPVPSLLPHILLLLHRIPLPLLPRLRQLLVSVRMDTNVLGDNLVMSSGLVAIFRLAVQESRDGIDHLVVLLSVC